MIAVVYATKAGFGGKQPLTVVLLMLALGVALLALFVGKQLRTSVPSFIGIVLQ